MASTNFEELFLLGRIIWVLVLTLLTLSYLTVGLRLWVRCRITKNPGWDDAAMLLTLMLFTCYCAFIIVITLRGGQAKLFNIDAIRVTLVYVQLSEVFYILTTTVFKISLGLFFLRVLTKRWQTYLFHTLLFVSATYGLFYTLTTIFTCGDPSKLANTLLDSKKCLPTAFILSTGYIYGTINVIADWTFVLIPICVLLESDLDKRSKISVSIVMALGAVGSVSSIMRMVYLKGLLYSSRGLTSNAIKATIWATAEPGTGIIAASIAILRPLIRSITTSVRGRASAYGGSKSSEEDTIALTSRGTASKKASVCSVESEDPWSPAEYGRANVQRVLTVQGGRTVLARV
ncbi:integral membrane protein [Ophiobolus disseminans]|uniref:Integral membrane protein n=1 Tax=Ophiobolus disseminans TaxID=1469910 RepID=A0A6A7A5N1_9PLEO|nr:integral membrane protein [Ophiobolus disseminans]